jgi:methionyl-tRNA formyltransferase
MRVVYLGNNWLGWQALKIIREHGDGIAALVLHPSERRKFGEEIIEAAAVDGERIIDATTLDSPETLRTIAEAAPDIGVSIMFGYILRPKFLGLFVQGCINLHTGLLPYNRGAHPNVWSIIDGTPAGVSIHFVDEGVDTGDIIAQASVAVSPADTGESLYRRLERSAVALFAESWPRICSQEIERKAQPLSAGTYHRVKDVGRIDEIDLDRTYRASDLIDIIRARTFGNYSGAYFKSNGRKVYMRLTFDEKTSGDEACG